MKHVAYIALGSNIEPRSQTLFDALRTLAAAPGVAVTKISQFVQTEPVGGPPEQPKYMNAAARVETNLSAQELLTLLLQIEAQFGRDRTREERWGPRTCDLDLLLFDDLVLQTESLTLPHPRMHERTFVLRPLAQIAPDAVHPVLNQTIAQLLAKLEKSN